MLESENSVLDTARYKAFRLRLDPFFALWDYERVAEILDIDDFINSMISFAFLQWQDWNQGAFLLDQTETEPRWRWVLWDADLAFAGLRPDGVPEKRAQWKNLRDAHGMRAAVFKGMWTNSPQFQKQLLHKLTWNINHRLTPEWITERVGHYAQLEKTSGIECFDENLALSYLLERRQDLLKETVTDLNTPQIVKCRIESMHPLIIDDIESSGSYEGMYFNGQSAKIEPRSPDNFSHWIVDGVQVHDTPLHIALEKDLEVTAVFLQSSAP